MDGTKTCFRVPKGRQYARRELHAKKSSAFTLLELIVVIAMLCALCALLLPARAYTTDLDKRAACRNNLRQLVIATTLYAGENGGKLLPARNANFTYVQLAISPIPASVAARFGLPTNSVPSTNSQSIWTCPNRPQFPQYQPQVPQWVIGYQYFAGVASWANPAGTFTSRSPTNLFQARPYWTLAADVTVKVNGVWGGQEPGLNTYNDAPQHHSADSLVPQGGNQVFMDGSTRWIPFERMYFLATWNTASRLAYFYQDPKDFPTNLKSSLPILRARP